MDSSDSPSSSRGLTPPVSSVIGGRYIVKQVLSQNEKSAWILVTDAQDAGAERVVVHIPLPEVDAETLALRLCYFEEAFEVAKRVRHRGLVPILDRFSTPEGEFVVMACVDGLPLLRVMSMSQARPTAQQVLQWAIQICEVLVALEDRPRPLLIGSLRLEDVLVTPGDRLRLQVRLDGWLHDSEERLYALTDAEVDARVAAFGSLLCELFEVSSDATPQVADVVNRCFLSRGAGGYPDLALLLHALKRCAAPAQPPAPPSPAPPQVLPLGKRLRKWVSSVTASLL